MEKRPILTVTSDAELAKTTQKALGESYDVVSASTTKEAWEKVVTKAPDLIILGYLAPRGTSFEFHKELRSEARTKDIPLLVIDVRPEEQAQKGWRRDEGMQMEADDYIRQPIEAAGLRKAIEELLKRASSKPKEVGEVPGQVKTQGRA